MDYNKLTSRQVHAAGVYDGWHEADFRLGYDRPSGRPDPTFTDQKRADQYAKGLAKGRERHDADLEVNGKPVTADARAVNAYLRQRNAKARAADV